MNVTDEIKSRLDIVDIVSEYLPLRKSGSSYSGFCPFHSNTRTPAFVVFPNTQTWRCFGACADGGDVFSFVMKKQGWEFKEALTHLAAKAGVTLEERRPIDKAQQKVEDRLADILSGAADYYHQLLLYAPQAEHARRYVAERGLGDETLSTFKVGFALDSWEAARNHFNMQGYDDDELVDVGLLTVNEEKGSRYDRFRNRLMIPILDLSGRVVGFGARTLDPDGLPKYLNSPQTTLFDKSHLLFGLDLAKRHIREARQVVIVEGYMDVMQAWQAGFRNVVAQMGTALTDSQLRLVKRFAPRFVLALDADAAGVQATLRSLDVARATLDRASDMRFDARGLVHSEGRLQADIRVVTLPEGNDPDKIIRQDPEEWLRLIAQAKPVVAYVIDVVTGELDMDDAKGKTAAAQRILPLINDVRDPVEREHYRQLLARVLQVDERVLRKVTVSSARAGRSVSQAPPATTGATGAPKSIKAERGIRQAAGLTVAMGGKVVDAELRQANYLVHCYRRPHLIAEVDNRLAAFQQPKVDEADFSRPEDQALWRHLRAHTSRQRVATIEDLCDSLRDEVLFDRLQVLLSLPEVPETDMDRLPGGLVLSLLDWRLEKVRGLIQEVQVLFHQARLQDNQEPLKMYSEQLQRLFSSRLGIDRAKDALSAANRSM